MNKYGLLFVCTGNICRSPTAEAVFRHRINQQGLGSRFRFDSAGTAGYHIGDPPDPRSIATAAARGIKMDDLRARQVAGSDFNDFDLVLAMDSGHYRHLERLAGANGSRLEMFLGSGDVPDPYYGGQEDFEHVLDLIERGVDDLLARLTRV